MFSGKGVKPISEAAPPPPASSSMMDKLSGARLLGAFAKDCCISLAIVVERWGSASCSRQMLHKHKMESHKKVGGLSVRRWLKAACLGASGTTFPGGIFNPRAKTFRCSIWTRSDSSAKLAGSPVVLYLGIPCFMFWNCRKTCRLLTVIQDSPN